MNFFLVRGGSEYEKYGVRRRWRGVEEMNQNFGKIIQPPHAIVNDRFLNMYMDVSITFTIKWDVTLALQQKSKTANF